MSKVTYQIAEIKLSYKNKPDLSSRPKITQSKDAYAILLDAWDEEQIGFVEEFKVLLLNRANTVLGIYHLATGGVTGVTVDPKIVFAAALKANACNLILAHNHPSENVVPSSADKSITKRLKEVGVALDITVLDHLIMSPHSYYSFGDDATYYRKDLGIDVNKPFIPLIFLIPKSRLSRNMAKAFKYSSVPSMRCPIVGAYSFASFRNRATLK